ncbi:MAG: hypothetical protein KF833_19355 [Verrucomicrobiae bacterium]|nr:hypothetical protein [Verrucomicrobiae bacterium]
MNPRHPPQAGGRRVRRSWLHRRLSRFQLFRILRHDRLFLVLFSGMALIALLVALGVPRIWRTTPHDFSGPLIRVSGIDLLQVKSLSRAAQRASRAHRPAEALYAWRSALANNFADVRTHRALLAFLHDQPRTEVSDPVLALVSVSWLMALTHTNRADVPLAADILEKFGRPHLALHLTEPLADLDDAVARAHARSLLAAGRYRAFDTFWERHGHSWTSDPVMTLYRDAGLAVTDTTSTGLSSLDRLRHAVSQPGPIGIRAARLLSRVAVQRRSVPDFERALVRLDADGAASVADHADLWRALAAEDRAPEARHRARDYAAPLPRDATVALHYLETLTSLDLDDMALAFLERHATRYGLASGIWKLHFDLLARAGRWNDLRRLATDLHSRSSRNDPVFPEVVWAEYRVAHAEGRSAEADTLAREIAHLPAPTVEAATRFASGLRAHHRATWGLQLLRNNETAFADEAEFWTELFALAYEVKDVAELTRAVEGLLRVQPGSDLWTNNRAALLLITGENPAEALQLTFNALSRRPHAVGLSINHALALVRNGRAAEAETRLQRIPASRLTGPAAANYHLAWVEVHQALGRAPEAAGAARHIDPSHLLPPQIQRLESLLPTPDPSPIR